MRTETPVVTRLQDYQPPAYVVETVDLTFLLEPEKTTVISTCVYSRNGSGPAALELDGENIQLIDIKINGQTLAKSRVKVSKSGLTIIDPPDAFELEITTVCDPSKNSTLMGLYVSGGRFCTQCEAQGFRRITYFQDRPDVLATYKVRIEADEKSFPTLLANGNCTAEGKLPNGRHYAVWTDPFPKPCYLFALVAGEFETISDSFKTMSGRTIPLDIYVDPGDGPRALYAMDALKRSMKWDEDTFGREYDLDRFMIVAVRDFNFGAMENKGLNIFNSSLLLADEASATDLNFEQIEAVVAHEYFHNWTGNRITCRDWFQLCLKEGFTVFRDQEFSADQRGHAQQRIKDVRALRARQFVEDAGPLAHPVRPASYMKIDNFYTSTIYEKGAELIRMLKTIIGADLFRKGCDLYFEKLDGTAATVEQFIECFEQASGKDLSQFMVWYEQAGTPVVHVKPTFNEKTGSLVIELEQSTPATPGQQHKKPVMIPIELGILDSSGRPLNDLNIVMEKKKERLEFNNLASKPVVSILRKFSAPVNLEFDISTQDRLIQMKSDPDLYNRWEAGQALARELLTGLTSSIETGKQPSFEKSLTQFVTAIGDIIKDETIDNGFKALALTLPGDGSILQEIAAHNKNGADPLAIRQAIKLLKRAIAEKHANPLHGLYTRLSTPVSFKPDAEGAGRRALRNTCLSLLAANSSLVAKDLARKQFETATNMTEELSALLTLVRHGGGDAEWALDAFYSKWAHNPLVVDKWFAANAQFGGKNALDRIKSLLDHPAYKGGNPNRIRALIGGFAVGNPERFHQMDGSGYRFYADNVLSVDKANPQVSARLLSAFGIWNKLDKNRRQLIRSELRRILDANPSPNAIEIATKSLGD